MNFLRELRVEKPYNFDLTDLLAIAERSGSKKVKRAVDLLIDMWNKNSETYSN